MTRNSPQDSTQQRLQARDPQSIRRIPFPSDERGHKPFKFLSDDEFLEVCKVSPILKKS